MEEEPLEDVSFLSKCFLIMDKMIQNEKATEEEIVLFFYPEIIQTRTKIQAISIASAMTDFSENFSKSSVSVVELKNVKLAYKEVGEFIMVLSGSVKDSNQALVHHIDLIWDCLQFYCGSFERIVQKSKKDRAKLQKSIRKKGRDLIPLVNSFHKSAMKFSPMPYTELSSGYTNLSSHFVMAWQLLNIISLNEKLVGSIYGCCLVYKASVVCTQLDVASTRWIANIVEGLEEDKPSTTPESEYKEFFYPVFLDLSSLSASAINKANAAREYVTENNPNNSDISTDQTPKESTEELEYVSKFSSSFDPIDLSLTDLPPHLHTYATQDLDMSWRSGRASLAQCTPEVPGRTPAGVYIVKIFGGLSLCALLTWPAFHEEHCIKKIFHVLRASTQLTKKLTRLLSKIAGGEMKRSFSSADIPTMRDINPQLSRYNFFSLDELTSMQNGHRGISDPDADNNFSMAINWAHDLFSERPEASKLVLRNHSGSIFCRKKFGKETFFQYSTEKFEEFEEIARHCLKTNHNINFV